MGVDSEIIRGSDYEYGIYFEILLIYCDDNDCDDDDDDCDNSDDDCDNDDDK
jgi:hypothetical protein